MHHEFAVEPSLVSRWATEANFRYFFEAFASDAGRFVAQVPERWRQLLSPHVDLLPQEDRARAEELIKRIEWLLVRRPGGQNESADWLPIALAEHERQPFRAILAETNPGQHPDILTTAETSPNNERWVVKRAGVFPQTSASLVNCARTLLRVSEEAALVDPYFEPQAPHWCEVLKDLLAEMRPQGGGTCYCRFHVRADERTKKEFSEDCDRSLPPLVPSGVDFGVCRWDRTRHGDRPHARYILTERGGVAVDRGLDAQPGMSTDIRILEEPIWQRRWTEYRRGGHNSLQLVDTWP